MLLPALNADLVLDPKGRVTLPRALRGALASQGINGLVAFANGGPSGGLALARIEDYAAMADKHLDASPIQPKSRLFALAIASTAQRVNVDGNGRILIPPSLRKILGLERDLFLFTAGSWIEVWDHDRWAQQGLAKAADMWDQLYGFESLLSEATEVAE